MAAQPVFRQKPDAMTELFGRTKALIGVIHSLPLPGAPHYDGMPVEDIYAYAVAEAERYAAGGFDGLIVENHGGLSSNGKWLAEVMKEVGHPRCGTLPDFGNFKLDGDKWYDRYQGVTELMPFAKAVSAKSHSFDAAGNETRTDFMKMMKIVIDAGYHGYVGIEWEGGKPGEIEGIKLTKKLLETCRDKLSGA